MDFLFQIVALDVLKQAEILHLHLPPSLLTFFPLLSQISTLIDISLLPLVSPIFHLGR